MNLGKTLMAGIAATSTMTLYSYLVSMGKDENFKEPELLAELSEDFLARPVKHLALPLGWLTHYEVGMGLALALQAYWQKNNTKQSVLNGLLAGAVAGIGGILAWKLAFRLHPRQPVIPYERFYGQLLLAHMIYGVTLAKYKKA